MSIRSECQECGNLFWSDDGQWTCDECQNEYTGEDEADGLDDNELWEV